MPDSDGKLTQVEKEVVKKWLLKWNIGPCPVCNKRNWLVGDHLVQPLTIGANKSLQLGGLGYPQVMVISTDCGYTHFLNAVIVGIAEKSPPETKVGQ